MKKYKWQKWLLKSMHLNFFSFLQNLASSLAKSTVGPEPKEAPSVS